MTDKRRRAYRWGQIAEHFAAVSLLLKGYRVVARRYKTPVGEVDLGVQRDERAYVEAQPVELRREGPGHVGESADLGHGGHLRGDEADLGAPSHR